MRSTLSNRQIHIALLSAGDRPVGIDSELGRNSSPYALATGGLTSAAQRRRSGHTLFELLIVVTVIGILASVAIPAMSSGASIGLMAAARVMASDLRLASDLAVQYSTQYTVTFNVASNQYQLALTGPGNPPALQNPYDQAGGNIGTYVVPIGQFGGNDGTPNGVRLLGANLKTSGQSVTNISFGSLGGTGPAQTDNTQIWLICGPISNPTYVRLTVTAITGQVWIDQPAIYSVP